MATLSVTPEVASAWRYINGILFGGYAIYIALRLASEEGKATRGAVGLETLCSGLLDYANFAPETCQTIEEILDELKKGIESDGKFTRARELLRRMQAGTRNDSDPVVSMERAQLISGALSAIEESCQASISPKSSTLINRGGNVLSGTAALSGETITEQIILGGLTSMVAAQIRDIVEDLDRPYGEEGELKLSIEPIEAARTHLKAIERLNEAKEKIRATIESHEQLNQNMIDSFYSCFRDIFDPWFENMQHAEKLEQHYLTANLSKPDTKTTVEEARALRDKTVLEGPQKPRFFLGDEAKEHGTFDMNIEIAFRHDDDHARQLALLEGTMKKIQQSNDLTPQQKTMATGIIKQWLKRVSGEKELIKEGLRSKTQTKTIEQQISDAGKAITAEIIGNIKSKGQSRYVFKRRQGSQTIEFETANRASDWEEKNVKTLLNPIHRTVITNLSQAALDDPENANKYRKVIEDINRARESQGLQSFLDISHDQASPEA